MASDGLGQLATLRRQLGSLSYDVAGLTPQAGPLVAALLGDLVQATDSFRAVKAQADDSSQATKSLQTKTDVLHREVARLSKENSHLHQDLLREADARQAQEASSRQLIKQLEAQAADLAFAKQKALEQVAVVERQRDALRAKVRDLLSFGQQHADELEVKAALTSFTATGPLEPKPAPAAAAKTSRGAISLIKAADSRILALEADVRRREAETAALVTQVQEAKDSLALRDAEIQRLSSQLVAGPDVDRLAQQYRNEANEAVILQLNQQVEVLTVELVEVQKRAVDRGQLEAAQQAQRQAETRANALTAERESVAREVEHMQAALVRLQQEANGEGAARQKLARLRSTLEGVRAEKALLEGQLTHAEAKVAELRDRLEQKEGALRKSQSRCKQLEGELAGKQQEQVSGNAQHISVSKAQNDALAEQVAEAKHSLEVALASSTAKEKECEELRLKVQELDAAIAATARQPASEAEAAPPEAPSAAPQSPADTEGVGTMEQRLAEKASQLEQLEFERTELLVKLEESEKKVAALAAALAARQHSLAVASAKERQNEGSLDTDSEDWKLEAGPVHDKQGLQPADQHALQQQASKLQERVQQLEGQVTALQSNLAAAQAAAAVDPAAMADLQRQLQERSQEVADLSALSIKADATVQQYMAQLRSMATELRAGQLRLRDAEAELARRAEEMQRHDAEVADLRTVVGALDAERDSLQAELDRRAESAAAEAAAKAAQCKKANEAERTLAAAEARLLGANSRLAEQEQTCQQQAAELEALGQQVAGMQAEYGALREEYRAVTDDLAALVKENQVISSQLESMTAERQELAEQVKVHNTRSHYNEQLARAREQDVSELRTAYEGLAHENQRLQQSLTELTRELQARDAELVLRAEEIASLHEAQRSAQSQINMYISDLQAYERQVEAMNRAMQRGDEAADGLDRERHALLEKLRTAEQVRFQLERAQEGLQRQLVHSEGGVAVLEARLADAQSDAEALKQRIALEQARVGELEGLLAVARADQYKRDAVAAESGADRQLASLAEQKHLLEQQVATLQRQVDGLVQRREAQDEELQRLQSHLAAEFSAGATHGSSNAKQQCEQLAQQLADAQQRCSELAAQAEEQRVEAARLADTQKHSDAELQAALANLAEVKQLLVQQEACAAFTGSEDVFADDGKLAQLEAQNNRLLEQLQALQADVGRQAMASGGLGSGVEELQQVQENERLLGLLSHMDLERVRLAKEKQELVGEVARLRAAPPKPAVAGPQEDGQGSDGQTKHHLLQLEQRQRQLEADLHAERQRRQQAELDFQELLASMELLHDTPSPASSSGSLQPALMGSDAGQQHHQLQAAVSSLQHIAQGLSSLGGSSNAAMFSGASNGSGAGAYGSARVTDPLG